MVRKSTLAEGLDKQGQIVQTGLAKLPETLTRSAGIGINVIQSAELLYMALLSGCGFVLIKHRGWRDINFASNGMSAVADHHYCE